MFRKTPQKQTTFMSPKGNEKQIDYILTKRRHLKHIKDAEANDMIHMGSDHRCIMAIFTISMPDRERSTQTAKSISIEMPKLEKYHEIVETIKNTAATKGNEAHGTRMDEKAQVKRENAAAAEANRTLEERRSMNGSSTVANQRGVQALNEHRRQDGWTPTPCV